MLWIFLWGLCIHMGIKGLYLQRFYGALSSMKIVSTMIIEIWNVGEKKLWKTYNNGSNIWWFSGGRWLSSHPLKIMLLLTDC